jgi:hypothetical protein
LYAAKFVRDTPGAELKLHTQCKLIEHIGNESPEEEYCDQLQKFFAFLHPQITGKSTTPYAQIPTLTPDEFLDHALSVPKPTPLCSLWTGYWLRRNGQLLAIAAAKDLMLRSIGQHPCHFQLMVNDLLEMEDLTQ